MLVKMCMCTKGSEVQSPPYLPLSSRHTASNTPSHGLVTGLHSSAGLNVYPLHFFCLSLLKGGHQVEL